MTERETVNTLWTGGWDSTFRVLQLILVHKATVQPHYVIDPERRSTLQELRALQEIRDSLSSVDSTALSRLRPTRLTLLGEIQPDQEIHDQYAMLRKRFELSGQYEWLNRYAKQHHLTGLEMGFQRNDDAPHFESLREHSIAAKAADGSNTWRLPAGHGDPNLRLFERFSFPNLWISKNEMMESAKDHRYLEILEKSWFCHYPIRGLPCGACSVCRHVMDAGMPQRFPTIGRFRNRIWWAYHPLRLLVSQPQQFGQRLSDLRRWNGTLDAAEGP